MRIIVNFNFGIIFFYNLYSYIPFVSSQLKYCFMDEIEHFLVKF